MIALYLGAVVAANLIIAHVGPAAVPAVSFALVGFVITARDRNHDRWADDPRKLTLYMGGLILAGGALSAAVNIDALPIAIASAVAFAASEAVNALAYHPMLRRGVPWLARVNLGNVPNAVVDSVLFVTLAFGFAPGIIALQVAAKILGGAMWSLLLARRRPAAA